MRLGQVRCRPNYAGVASRARAGDASSRMRRDFDACNRRDSTARPLQFVHW